MGDKETKVTVLRVAEVTAWVRLSPDDNGSELPLADGGFAFEHDVDEKVFSVDYARVPNVRPKALQVSPTSNEKLMVGLCAMRVVFIGEPMTPEEASVDEQQIEIDPKTVAAGQRIIVPNGAGR